MARARSPNREMAEKMYLENNGEILLKHIAEKLGVSDTQVRKWKNQDNWESKLISNVTNVNSNVTKRTGAPKGNKNAVGNGAPKGNKNAVGNDGGAPVRNSNAVTHGFFRKFFPEDTLEIMEQLEKRSPIDMLWDNIVIQYTAIIRAQQLMFVRDKQDETKVKTKEKYTESGVEEQWAYQHAWDKHATFLQAQSRAMTALQSLIRQYEDLATGEQLLRVEKLKAEVKALNNPDGEGGQSGLDQLAEVIAKSAAAIKGDA
ncbi:phage terminase small subunit [Brevibacillus ginsengisoli]|uniref:phage terminase small subunit n=1 Tax=Brevibacillus ginsengisoli TaxID=363854 RepID=UPI003CF13535